MQKGVLRVIVFFEALPMPIAWLAMLVTTVLIGVVDYASGVEVTVSPLYILPVLASSLCLGRRSGVFFAFLDAYVPCRPSDV